MSAGFTLIEVLAAILIFSIAILGFHQGQASSARLVLKSENQARAIALAQMQMTEIELQLKKKNFEGFPEEEKGEFKDEKLKDFIWNRKFEKVDLGCFQPTSKKSKEAGGDQNQQQTEGAFSIAEKIFEQAVRKITVTVEYQEGSKKRKASLTQLYVRFEDIPAF